MFLSGHVGPLSHTLHFVGCIPNGMIVAGFLRAINYEGIFNLWRSLGPADRRLARLPAHFVFNCSVVQFKSTILHRALSGCNGCDTSLPLNNKMEVQQPDVN
jgi:hypothetical protein